MSRQSNIMGGLCVNGLVGVDSGQGCKSNEVINIDFRDLNLDTSKLKMPFKSRQVQAGGGEVRLNSVFTKPELRLSGNTPNYHHDVIANDCESIVTSSHAMPSIMSIKPPQDVTIELCVEPRSETRRDLGRAWEFAGWLVPTGYTLFGAALVLSNLTIPNAASTTCVCVSPLPMLCLLAHSTIVSFWVGVCLVVCAWSLPVVCSLWQLPVMTAFSFFLGAVVLVGSTVSATSTSTTATSTSTTVTSTSTRCLVGVGMLGLSISLLFALTSSLHGIEPKWGASVAGFFLCIMCGLATRQMGKVVYKVKQFVG